MHRPGNSARTRLPIRHALLRDAHGNASSPLGAVLDHRGCPMISRAPDTQRPGVVVIAPFVRIEPERDGQGWIVITANGNGWILAAARTRCATSAGMTDSGVGHDAPYCPGL